MHFAMIHLSPCQNMYYTLTMYLTIISYDSIILFLMRVFSTSTFFFAFRLQFLKHTETNIVLADVLTCNRL